MNQHVTAVLLMMIICISGCAQSLPPHEELDRAVKKSFDATGLNFSSKNRITNISMKKKDADTDSADKRLKYLDAGLGILKGFSVNANGAIDKKAKRSEVIYDLHYDKDNVEVSVKFPMLVDYGTQTIYVGTSFFTTILEAAFPQAPSTRGKLVRLNINEFLQDDSAKIPKVKDLVDKDRFSSKNMDSINGAVRAGILKALAKVNDSCFTDQPLTDQDKKDGVGRHIHVNLGHDDSVAVVVDLVDGVSQALFQDGVISKKEYGAILTLTDKKSLDGFVGKFTMETIFDVGIARSGFVSYVDSQLHVADKNGKYQLGLNNVSSFSSYNDPHFTLAPETSGVVDFKELEEVITADKAKEQDDSTSSDETPDTPDTTRDSDQKDI